MSVTIVVGGITTPLAAQGLTPQEAAALSSNFFVDEHGNAFRRVGDTYFITTNAFAHHQLAQQGLREPIATAGIAPPWAVPQYINHNRRNAQSNSALRNAMEDFYLREAPYFDNPFPMDWVIPALSPNDLRVSADFAETFLHAFSNDSFSQTLPFNDAYLEQLLGNVDFYFATRLNRWYWNGDYFDFMRLDYPYGGFFNSIENVVFISATREWTDVFGYRFVFYNRFARTSIHEVGHVLGLGESLAHLFEEKFMSLDAPLRPGNWERDSSFDRALLAMAGPYDFWTAAFSSNAAYGQLWNMHFGHLFTFADLQMERGLARHMRIEGILPEDYQEIPGLFYLAFAPGTPDARRPMYVAQVQLAVANLNEFVAANGLQINPLPAVFDNKIHN